MSDTTALAGYLTDDRMPGLDQRMGSVGDELDDAAAFSPRDDIGIAERTKHVPVHNLCGGNDFDHLQLVGCQRGQPHFHQLDELRVDPQSTIHPPATVVLYERTVGECSRQQTTQE